MKPLKFLALSFATFATFHFPFYFTLFILHIIDIILEDLVRLSLCESLIRQLPSQIL